MDCGEIRAALDLDRCASCGACTQACPSARHGGVVPDESVSLVVGGRVPERIWDCLLCHRCTMACPEGIDVAEMMSMLRNASGDTPERFLRAADRVYRTGRTVQPSGRTASQREALGLPAAGGQDAEGLRRVLDREGWPHG